MKIIICQVISCLFFSFFISFQNLSAQSDFTSTTCVDVSFTNSSALLGSTVSSVEDCAVDMNGDFLDDIVRVNSGNIYIDYQQADGSFQQQTYTAVYNNSPNWSLCAGDIDANGYNDLLFGNTNNVSFIHANSDGTVYTEDFRSEYIFSQRSTFADIDNDGHLDAFVCHDVDQSHPYRNDGLGNLVLDQSLITTADLPGNYAAIWVDYDNDRDIDLYITKCKLGSNPGDIERTNLLYQNNGDGTFTEVGAAANMDDNSQSWATVFEDFDNDGDFDAFIVNHDFTNRFMENNGDGTFTDIMATTGIPANDLGAFENATGDFNNDGFIDILVQLAGDIYLNNGDMTFSPINVSFDDGGIGDFNNDGFLDVIRGNVLWMNDGICTNNYVKINTIGTVSNRNGIGARVEIHGAWGMQSREVRSGQSFSPMSSLNTHFGIGTATAIDKIVVKWPSGLTSTLMNPSINTTHQITESALAIDLIDFTTTTTNNSIVLNWAAIHEADMKGYEIQRSINQVDFEKIAWNDAINSPNQKQFYYLEDKNVALNQDYYYRLKMLEENGKESYSNIQVARLNGKSLGVHLFPNPAIDQCEIIFEQPLKDKTELVVYNIFGQEVYRSLVTEQGYNLSMGDWASGLYYVHIFQEQDLSILSLIKE